jgi:hypothetical protein
MTRTGKVLVVAVVELTATLELPLVVLPLF